MLTLILVEAYLMLVLDYKILATNGELSESLFLEEDASLETVLKEVNLQLGNSVENRSCPGMQEEEGTSQIFCHRRRNPIRTVLLDLTRHDASLPWLLDKIEVYFCHALVPN